MGILSISETRTDEGQNESENRVFAQAFSQEEDKPQWPS